MTDSTVTVFVDAPLSSSPTGIVVAAANSPAAMVVTADFACDGIADDIQIQAAIDLAQTHAAGSTSGAGAPRVLLLPGTYHLSSGITAKSAGMLGLSTPNIGVRVLWDGAPGATVITKAAAYAGGGAFWELGCINFRAGTSTPGTWLDLTAAHVDAQLKLTQLHFVGAAAEHIKVAGWVNCHWRDLRFDAWGTYAMTLTPDAGINLSTFSLDGFTCDNNPSTTCLGVFKIDNSAGASNVGTFRLANGRIELNKPLNGPGSVIDWTGGRSLGLQIENVTVDNVIASPNAYLIYSDVSASSISLVLVNVRQGALAGILGGALISSAPVIPLQNNYGLVAVADWTTAGQPSAIVDTLNLNPYTTTNALQLRRGSETNDRLQIDNTAKLTLGPGTSAGDTNLYRGGANLLKTDDRFVAVDGVTTKTKAGVPADADFASPPADGTLVVDTTGSKLYVRIGGAWKATAALS